MVIMLVLTDCGYRVDKERLKGDKGMVFESYQLIRNYPHLLRKLINSFFSLLSTAVLVAVCW